MNVKTITGPSIASALNEARALYGDQVVLLESNGPSGDRPARISVLADRAATGRPVVQAETTASPYGRARIDLTADDGRGDSGDGADLRRALDTLRARAGAPEPEQTPRALPARRSASPQSQAPRRETVEPQTPGRGRLHSPIGGRPTRTEIAVSTPAAVETVTADVVAQALETHLAPLLDRIAGLERRLSTAAIGAAHAFAAHPLYAGLLNQGMRPQTAMALFNGLADKGFGSDTPEADLRWALAQELRKRLEPTTPSRAVGTQVVCGPSGSGKTSLILKLALHPSFYGRRSTGILVVLPEDDAAQAFHNPVDVYRRHGLAVQSVQHPSEMPDALDRMRAFDQILIDTPPLPRKRDAMAGHLRRLKQMIDPIMPLQVTFVYSAADALDGVREGLFDGLPLTPDAVALTHLDETTGWGRLADWLLALERPVPYVSCGPRTPDDLYGYSPTWFVEEMMQLR